MANIEIDVMLLEDGGVMLLEEYGDPFGAHLLESSGRGRWQEKDDPDANWVTKDLPVGVWVEIPDDFC